MLCSSYPLSHFTGITSITPLSRPQNSGNFLFTKLT
jgi:hypothetical protein